MGQDTARSGKDGGVAHVTKGVRRHKLHTTAPARTPHHNPFVAWQRLLTYSDGTLITFPNFTLKHILEETSLS